MHRALWLGLLLVTGCQRIFGADLPSDAATPGDGTDPDGDAPDARPPGCASWFEESDTIPSTTIASATAIKAGHFDSDGQLDLVLTSSMTAGVTISRSQGNGTFGGVMQLASSANLRGSNLVLGDLNRDDALDVVVGGAAGTFEIFRTEGAVYTSTAIAGGTGATVPALIEADGNNMLDIAVARTADDLVRFYTQDALGVFTAGAGEATGEQPLRLEVVDLDGSNSIPELVTANGNADTITMLTGDGNGTWVAAPAIFVGAAPRWLAVGRVNADSQDDLVVSKATNQIELVFGDAGGSLTRGSVREFDAAITSVEVADLDGDQLAELVVLDASVSQVYVITHPGDMGGETRTPITVLPNAAVMVLGDFTGDERIDLAIANASGDLRVYPNCR